VVAAVGVQADGKRAPNALLVVRPAEVDKALQVGVVPLDVRVSGHGLDLSGRGIGERRGEGQIEGHHLADVAPLAGSEVAQVAGGECRMLLVQPPGKENILAFEGPNGHIESSD
jgi:hypothetical protein